ncbi:MAG: putative aminoglycoside phosphotransferase (protein kinase related), diverged, partial [Paenibacillus sp.]|nr:putative aminoglycoside phosphotransferase (protein kinase related), diverged [Paenibacillus sp.]
MDELVVIGRGNTADVYEWVNGNCIKLFKPEYEENAQKEFNITQQIMKTNLRIPTAKEIINFKGRRGIVYEQINGPLMYSAIMNEPTNLEKWGQMFADIHYEIHSCSTTSLSSPRDGIRQLIERCGILTSEWKKTIISVFESLTDKPVLIHGDFHPLNIVLTESVPFVIDWNNSSTFHPLADVALTSVILQVAGFPSNIQEYFHDSYIKRYLQLSMFDYKEFLRWQIPMSVVRLSE